jgi:ankyrin repeat protein
MEEIRNFENELTFAEIEQFVNADWGHGSSLLHLAVEQDDFKLVKQCIQFSADVNKLDNYGQTALFNCSSLEIAKYLVEYGVDVNILNHMGVTAVVKLYNSNKDLIKYLAEITDLDVEDGKYNPSTLLYEMISNQEGDLSLFKIVIPRTKNINRTNYTSSSYLMSAVKNKKYLDVIKMLIELGKIDLYLRDRDGKNFYDLAFIYVQKEIKRNYPEYMRRKDMTDQQRQVLDRADKLKHLNSISNRED